MSEERLWAPWRAEYVKGSKSSGGELPEPAQWLDGAVHSCFLCRAAARHEDQPAIDRQLLVAGRTDHALAILNRYPYSNGHLLVAPLRHAGELGQLLRDEHFACMEWLVQLTDVLKTSLQAEGFNIGLNVGQVSGAGLPGHLHWHLVPRWPNDHNFMTTTAGTRIIPQALDALWELVTKALNP